MALFSAFTLSEIASSANFFAPITGNEMAAIDRSDVRTYIQFNFLKLG